MLAQHMRMSRIGMTKNVIFSTHHAHFDLLMKKGNVACTKATNAIIGVKLRSRSVKLFVQVAMKKPENAGDSIVVSISSSPRFSTMKSPCLPDSNADGYLISCPIATLSPVYKMQAK